MTECHKPSRCLRETNPGNGIFFGEAFVYDEDYYGCYLCKRELEHRNEKEGEELNIEEKEQV